MKPPVLFERRASGVDIWLLGRRALRLTRRRAGLVYGFLTVLRAHKGGKSVLKSEAADSRWLRLRTICGVLICTRWGSLMVQWRGFGTS